MRHTTIVAGLALVLAAAHVASAATTAPTPRTKPATAASKPASTAPAKPAAAAPKPAPPAPAKPAHTAPAPPSRARTETDAAYQPGHLVGSAYLGLGVAGIYGSSGMPLLGVAAEYGVNDKISIGGSIGHTSSTEDLGYYGGKWTYGYTIVAARGSYHFGDQLNIEKLDAYAGVSLGYAVVSSSYSNGYYDYNYYGRGASSSFLAYGIHGGARYWFTPKIAGFGELGFGLGNLVVGASMRF